MGRIKVEDPKLAEVKAILSRLQRMSPDDGPMPFDVTFPREVAAPQLGQRIEIPSPLPATASPAPVKAAAPIEPVPPIDPPGDIDNASLRTWGALAFGCSVAALTLFLTRTLWLPIPAQKQVAAVPAQAAAALPPSPAPAPAKIDLPPAAVKSIPVETTAPAPAASEVRSPAPAVAAVAPTIASVEPPPTIQRAHSLIQRGEITAGRTALLALSPERSVEAAWALARSYDPNVVGTIANADARADVDQATRWYRQWHSIAIEQGLVADSISVDRIIRSMQR